MNLIAHIKEAFLNLSSAKLRSSLALLGILVGTASVVAMVSGGELATNEALKQFKTLGTNLLSVTVNENQEDDRKHARSDLSLTQILALDSADKNILTIAPYTQLYNPIQYNGHAISGTILGVTDKFAKVVNINVSQGRSISAFDDHALFCMVGHKLYDEMKKISFEDPLGKQVQIGQNFFTVVGIAENWPENSFVYANIDNSVLIPILTSSALSQYATINNFILKLAPNADLEKLNTHISDYVKQYAPSKHLFFRSAKELISSMGKQSQILTVFLGLIGGISLLVGGIGVMNIMLVSIVERRREIGIRLAVGARRKDIRYLFLVEAVMLSLIGGTLGVVIGILIAYIITLVWHWEFILFFWPPVIGFSVSVAIGIFFGFYPAYQASRLDPIVALRSD
ncbi:MAG: ABC transporter permease [Gammaproteobacteria bacterium]|nr:ABC transporter permease [Gammaproteobacteria bacterium]